jgi:hypothetical protein
MKMKWIRDDGDLVLVVSIVGSWYTILTIDRAWFQGQKGKWLLRRPGDDLRGFYKDGFKTVKEAKTFAEKAVRASLVTL